MSVDQSAMTPTEIRLGVFRYGYNPLALNGKNPSSGQGVAERPSTSMKIRSGRGQRPGLAYANTGVLTQ